MKGGRRLRPKWSLKALVLKLYPPKAFDQPYIIITGYKNNIPFVWPLLLPAHYNYHRLDPVLHKVEIQPSITVEVRSLFLHCRHCKLMGSLETFQEYSCLAQY